MNSASTHPLPITAAYHDAAGLIAAAHSDPTAFSHLYRLHVTGVYRYCISRVGNTADAEDLTTQVFTEVWENSIKQWHVPLLRLRPHP
jgi:DNA-directed RNA polymerase specialized sigma24 family protein